MWLSYGNAKLKSRTYLTTLSSLSCGRLARTCGADISQTIKKEISCARIFVSLFPIWAYWSKYGNERLAHVIEGAISLATISLNQTDLAKFNEEHDLKWFEDRLSDIQAAIQLATDQFSGGVMLAWRSSPEAERIFEEMHNCVIASIGVDNYTEKMKMILDRTFKRSISARMAMAVDYAESLS